MGFQGDVAGIGLGELLQGLARGGREGVLTLRAGNLNATLGVQQGQLYLLPEPDEEPEIWLRRCERAWAKDPDENLQRIRMSEIAYSARLERVFDLLDCEGVHFRFEPGPLPDDSGVGAASVEGAHRGSPVHCPGISVEFLLLEHARLSDECHSYGDSTGLSVYNVPVLLDANIVHQTQDRLLAECDGLSNVLEISDRLAWPLRQTRASIQEYWAKGALRLSIGREFLLQFQHELQQEHFARAATRLSGWCMTAPPGPPPEEDVRFLANEWTSGRLQTVVRHMEVHQARVLLRRIEWYDESPEISLERWNQLTKLHRHDVLAQLRVLSWRIRIDDGDDGPSMADLLKLARSFQDRGSNLRAGVMLRLAAARLPESTSMRLELGNRMLAVGLVEEGAPWVIDACKTLIESNLAEKALGPLRTLLNVDPGNTEARQLLITARTKSASGRRRRRNVLIGFAGLLLLAAGAVVQTRIDKQNDTRIDEIAALLDQPAVALSKLEAEFPASNRTKVVELRNRIHAKLEAQERLLREAWLEKYDECKEECATGDPLVGLDRALELPAPPVLQRIREPWPRTIDLYRAVATRLDQRVGELAAPVDASAADIREEERLTYMVESMMDKVAKGEPDAALESFGVRLSTIYQSLEERGRLRAEQREALLRQQRIEEQDLLLAAARAHAEAGDLQRAVETFKRLVSMEGSAELEMALNEEIDEVEAHLGAFVEARRLAGLGEHEQALELLSSACPNPSEHLLPMRIESHPPEARARFADGSTRITPFELEAAPGEHIEFTLELDEHESARVVVNNPRDETIRLARLPRMWWRTSSRVDAPPVAIEGDYILCDREGDVVRLGKSSTPLWERTVESLGGISRAPVFLPKRPGHMLILTEDGQAWILEAKSGKLEGPYDMGSPPHRGPLVDGNRVTATFADGSSAVWEGRLRPQVHDAPATSQDSSLVQEPSGGAFSAGSIHFGSTAGLTIMRRRSGGEEVLQSNFTEWSVEVQEEQYAVSFLGSDEARKDAQGFVIRREGQWAFLAWEAPHHRIPRGRLWISDEAGLRAFEP